MRVILTGGGTGGHVNPALAIADIIKTNVPDAEIAFVGTSRGIENKLVTKAGYKLYHVEINGIARSLSPSNIKTAYRIATSPAKAKKVLREFAPDIVIGTGGYACWPSVYAASKMGIPTMLHEANATPGFAVKTLCKKVDVIMTNFEHTANEIKTPKRTVAVGMPMRGAFGRLSKAEARRILGISDKYKIVILSFGGSLGAPEVNKGIIEIMEKFSGVREDVYHIHACGSRNFTDTEQLYKNMGLGNRENIELSEYIYDMATKMAAADIVICRSGAMTLTEIARLGKAAILIPSPNVTNEHQLKNAKVLEDAGAALIVEEKDFASGKLLDSAIKLAEDRILRKSLEERIGAFYDADTGRKIFCEIENLLSARKKK